MLDYGIMAMTRCSVAVAAIACLCIYRGQALRASHELAGFPEDLGPFYLYDAGFKTFSAADEESSLLQDSEEAKEKEETSSADTPIPMSVEFEVSSDKKTWKAGDASGVLSQKKDVFMPDLADAFGLEKDTLHSYAFAHPDPKYADDDGVSPAALFKKLGGFVYFGNCGRPMAVKGIAPMPRLVKFGAAEQCPSCKFEHCPGASGFVDYMPVTIPAIKAYATHFCWLDVDTCAKFNPRHQDGCFAFKEKRGGKFVIYPVSTVQKQGDFPEALHPMLLFDSVARPQLVSEWSELLMPSATRQALGVPDAAKSFKWAYATGPGLDHGGFHYSPVDVTKKIVNIQYKIEIAEPMQVSFQSVEDCAPWREVGPFEKERQPEAKRFCWDTTDSGAFLYEMEDGSVLKFPVATPNEP